MIDLKDITFAYTDKTILNNINLHIMMVNLSD